MLVVGMRLKIIGTKQKKPIVLIHTDIYFDQKYLENILSNKKKYYWNSF